MESYVERFIREREEKQKAVVEVIEKHYESDQKGVIDHADEEEERRPKSRKRTKRQKEL